ncbi:MAG TPA: ice-binding family protein, partial [Byssovorax sp.]
MLQTIASYRRLACFAVLVPFAVGCSNGAVDDSTGGGAGSASGVGGGVGAEASTSGSGAGTPDSTPPTVVSSYPVDAATDVATTLALTARFSEAMAPASLVGSTFRLEGAGSPVTGEVTYFDDVVTFAPEADLMLGTTYVATIEATATDVAGNALATPYSWSFTTETDAPAGPAPVFLGAAGNYVILAKSAISNVPMSDVTGDVGLSPAAASYITGFALTQAGTRWTSTQVTGSVFAADNDPPTPAGLTTAVSDMQTAYTDAAARPTPTALNLDGGGIGGLTITPGLYRWTSAVTIPSDVTLAGAPNDVFIFQVTGDLSMSAAAKMILTGGAQPKNVFWQVAGAVDLGAEAHAEGVVLSKTAIKLQTG